MISRFFVIVLTVYFFSCGSKSNENQSNKNEPSEVKPEKDGLTENESEEISLGTEENPIQFYLTPSLDREMLESTGQKLIDFLSSETSLKYNVVIPANYEEMIDAFGQKKAHVALMNSLSYVKAKEAHEVNVLLKAVRYGKSNYYGEIITNSASGIESVEDINGKSIAYTDSSSGSGFLYPSMILRQKGVVPSRVTFVGTHDEVVRQVYKGQFDAGACFYAEPTVDGTVRDARSRLLEEFPDITNKVKIITVTQPIPNDPVVFSSDIPRDLKYDIALSIIKFTTMDDGGKVMDDMFSIQSYVRSSDAEYDEFRAIAKQVMNP
jgi:phosphonate transport system substrate-binding protein